MDWMFQEKNFGIARLYGCGTNFTTGVRIKILPNFNPIQDGIFWGCSQIVGTGGAKKPPFPKIWYTYPTLMKFGTVIPHLEKIQKIYESRNTPLESSDISIFLLEISKFCYIKNYRYRVHLDT